MTSPCIFCDILQGRAAAEFLFENERIAVIRDIRPSVPIHRLIPPGRHIRSVNDLTPEDRSLVGEMILAGKDVAEREGLSASGYKLLFNIEKAGAR